MGAKFDIYAEITNRIIKSLSEKTIPWQKPWIGGTDCAINGKSGKPYSLLNQFILSKPGKYYSFKQIQDLKAKVKKGEKSAMVVFWKIYETESKDLVDQNGDPIKTTIPILRYYNVFHEDQIEDLPEQYKTVYETQKGLTPDKINKQAEMVFNNYTKREGIKVNKVKGDRAFYSPSTDSITLPLDSQFTDDAERCSTMFHESVHSTGAKNRLSRDFSGGFGSEQYSKEELVAEIGASFILKKLGVNTEKSMKNNESYIKSWIKVLKDDPKMIVGAAGKAEKAAKFIFGDENNESE